MPDLRENLQEANGMCQQTVSPEGGRVVSQWRVLIGTGRESGEISEGKESKQGGGMNGDVGRRLSPKSTCGGV